MRRQRLWGLFAASLALALLVAAVAGAEVVQKGSARVVVTGKLSPQRLPRTGVAPIAVSVGGHVSATGGGEAPRLKTLQIELNRNGRLDYKGLPTCSYNAISTASTSRARSTCKSALVGQGSFDAEITLAGGEPYPISGNMLAFNGRKGGRPVLYGHIYAPRPFPTSFVIVFMIGQRPKGTFGTVLSAKLPASLSGWGNLTGIELELSRRFSYHGKSHSYLSAGCPAPKGFPGASFALAKTSFGFVGGSTLSSTLTRSCKVRS